MREKIVGIVMVLIGFAAGFWTPSPKYCLQYFDGIKPIYNLGCILEESSRQATISTNN